ncbi:FHA domain-containing protein [Fuerstiella marisgermanici]|uniref:Glycogen accumulation regulator GarA n=1 Tax=Fuerstiella marisgermanici TaxID=1891926 RepID=A0A1P8WJV6_9PLAN|nr:FHA domain-containing protein [Fuerstiella marisgermanici]APZ94328.1 Glycogen accumulation regulator GarA [Fuerstiella marisgermanici]
MAQVTISILEGLERGRTFRDLETPVTIGREEDNVIQLNDERVSRIHAKLQEDRGQVILTDLNSTNGSRVNGHPVQLRVLQPGDHVQIGRCTLLFGSDAEIAEHAQQLGVEVASLTPLSYLAENGSGSGSDSGVEFELADDLNAENLQLPLFPGGAPALPDELEPGQRARVSDVLGYIHERMRDVSVNGADPQDPDGNNPVMEVPWAHWQNLMQLQRDLALYLRQIANPD